MARVNVWIFHDEGRGPRRATTRPVTLKYPLRPIDGADFRIGRAFLAPQSWVAAGHGGLHFNGCDDERHELVAIEP
jgi:hypothetical protein